MIVVRGSGGVCLRRRVVKIFVRENAGIVRGSPHDDLHDRCSAVVFPTTIFTAGIQRADVHPTGWDELCARLGLTPRSSISPVERIRCRAVAGELVAGATLIRSASKLTQQEAWTDP